MDLRGWNDRYRERRPEDLLAEPTPLLVEVAGQLKPGRVLDLASGNGRNAIWLAEHGWHVTAVDGAQTAIDILREQAARRELKIDAHVTDLANGGVALETDAFDLVAVCYYLKRSLFEPARLAVRQGGTLLAIVHIIEGDEQPNANRLRPGELRQYFADWHVTHYYEGKPNDPAHKRAAAEIVAKRP